MDRKDICRKIDYTLLKPTATFADFHELCAEAYNNKCASVCIPSSYVKIVREWFPKLTICTVVGFPLGNSTTCTKMAETMRAIYDGANEIDMVINISKLKEGDYNYILTEINAIKQHIGDKILKVIIETCYLTKEEIAIATQIVDCSRADYVKTSTGFGTYGARVEDVEIMVNNIKNGTKVKASGGIRTEEDMRKYLEIGCDRIGASTLPQQIESSCQKILTTTLQG